MNLIWHSLRLRYSLDWDQGGRIFEKRNRTKPGQKPDIPNMSEMSDTSELPIPSEITEPPLSPDILSLDDTESGFFNGGIPENDSLDAFYDDFGDFDLGRVSKWKTLFSKPVSWLAITSRIFASTCKPCQDFEFEATGESALTVSETY